MILRRSWLGDKRTSREISAKISELTFREVWVVPVVIGLSLLEISFTQSLLLLLTLSVLSRLGKALSGSAGYEQVGFGIGVLIGGGCFVFATQILLLFGVPANLAHIGSLIAAYVIAQLLRQRADLRSFAAATPDDNLLFVVSVTLLVIAIRHPWLIPFALFVAVLQRFAPQTISRVRNTSLFAVALVSSWQASLALRPDRWWYFYQNNDSQFFEAIGWSGAHWGVSEHPGFVGGSIAAYHWFSYVFIGNLSHLAALQPWEGQMKLAVPLTTLIATSILLSGRITSLIVGFSLIWSLVFLAIAGFSFPVFDSNLFGTVVAFAYLHLAVRQSRAAVWRLVCFWTPFSTILIFSKTTTAILVIAVLLIFQVTNRGPLRNWIPVCILLANSVLSYMLVFQNSPAASALTVERLSTQAILRSIYEMLVTYYPPLLIALFGLGTYLIRTSPIRSNHPLVRSLVIVLAGSTGALSLVESSTFEVSYLIAPTTLLLALFITRAILEQSDRWNFPNTFWNFCSSLLILLCGFAVSILGQRSVAAINNFLSESGSLGITGVYVEGTIYALIATISVVILAQRSSSQVRTIGLATVFAVGLFSGLPLQSYRQSAIKGADSLTNWRGGNSAPFSDNDLRQFGKWVRANTDESIVLASNNFCCEGSEWWEELLQVGELYELDLAEKKLGVENSYGGNNYLLPVETRRRFLVQGLGFQIYHRSLSSEQSKRVSLSLEFANQPTLEGRDELLALGVGGFVVHLALTETREWGILAEARYRLGNYLFLDLNRDQ